MPLLVRPSHLLVVVALAGCGGAKRDMEKVCDAEARAGATIVADRAKVLAWIDANAGGDARRAADDAFAKPPAEASATLRAASAKLGVASCPLADALAVEPEPPTLKWRPPTVRPLPTMDPAAGAPKLLPPPANQAKVEATGGLTQEAAAAAVETSKVGLTLCYESARQKQPRLSGRVKLEVDVGATGAATAKDAGSSIDAAVVACMRGVLAKTKFPAPNGGHATVTVSYDLVPTD